MPRISVSFLSLTSLSCALVSHKIQRAESVICSYRADLVVLVMEMGGDTHSFRSFTYRDQIRGLLRHRGSLVNRRTLSLGRGGRKRDMRRNMTRVVGEGEWVHFLAFYWAQQCHSLVLIVFVKHVSDQRINCPPGNCFGGVQACLPKWGVSKKSHRRQEEKVDWEISHLEPPVVGWLNYLYTGHVCINLFVCVPSTWLVL